LSANEIYLSGSTGGTANVTLTVNNLPSHTHSLTADGRHGADAAYAADLYSSWGDMYHEPRTKQTSATGSNQPFTIIPPYVALIACKKVNATRVNCS
jgi:microcystin-dependent protein